MTELIKKILFTTMLVTSVPVNAASIISNDSLIRVNYNVVDAFGVTITDEINTNATLQENEFLANQEISFDSSQFEDVRVQGASGSAEAKQSSFYNTDQFSGSGNATSEVVDPFFNLFFWDVTAESKVDLTFEIETDHTYTLSADLFANLNSDVGLLFDGHSTTESGSYLFSGNLAAGRHSLTIVAFSDSFNTTTLMNSSFNYDLKLTEVSAVPVPAAFWLFCSGLMTLLVMGREGKTRRK